MCVQNVIHSDMYGGPAARMQQFHPNNILISFLNGKSAQRDTNTAHWL